MIDRLAAAWRALQAPASVPKADMGEVAFADPRRLFPGGYSRPYDPSVLVSRQGRRIFDQMRRDDQIKAALAFKKHTVTATGWTVTSPEGLPADWEPTRFVRWNLTHLDPGEVGGGTLDHDLQEILSALDYGFSLTEKIHAPIEDGPFAGKIGLKSLKTRAPHAFQFEQDVHGNLAPNGIIQQANTLVENGRLPREKFVHFVHDPLFGNPYGTSDLDASFSAWWIKDNASKWLAILLERLGIPPVFGLYNPGNYLGESLNKLKDVIKNIQAATFGIIPRPTKDSLEFWAPELAGQATRVFLPSLQYLDQRIARAILMPGLLGMTQDTSQGSFARARVHFDVFVLVIEAIRMDVERIVMRDQVIRPLVDLNYPGLEVYPVWAFLPLTDELRIGLLSQWTSLVKADVVTRQPEDETHIRKLVKFPERQAKTGSTTEENQL